MFGSPIDRPGRSAVGGRVGGVGPDRRDEDRTFWRVTGAQLFTGLARHGCASELLIGGCQTELALKLPEHGNGELHLLDDRNLGYRDDPAIGEAS